MQDNKIWSRYAQTYVYNYEKIESEHLKLRREKKLNKDVEWELTKFRKDIEAIDKL